MTALFFFAHQLGKKYPKLLVQQSHLSGLVRWYQQSVDQHWLRSTLRMLQTALESRSTEHLPIREPTQSIYFQPEI